MGVFAPRVRASAGWVVDSSILRNREIPSEREDAHYAAAKPKGFFELNYLKPVSPNYNSILSISPQLSPTFPSTTTGTESLIATSMIFFICLA